MLVLLSFFSNTAFNFGIGLLLARFLGPDQYGRFALAVSCAVVLQTVCFDWARAATTRFFSERTARDTPSLRATLDTGVAAIAVVVALVALVLLLGGLDVPLTRSLAALAAVAAISNGVFDYWTALVRARFLDRAYARLILTKNLLSAVLTLGAAFWFQSAAAALLGLCLSMAGGALAIRTDLRRPTGTAPRPERGVARMLLRYALPIVAANLLYQSIPLADRLLIARHQGFAQSGQFSLAYDVGLRVVSAIGSALDVLLFQIAVRADEQHGAAHAKEQIGRNIGIVVAILLPACTGLWIVMPAFEALVVPPEFRGPFGTYLRVLLPGLFCYGVIGFALSPLFQIGKRTAPLVAVAGLAATGNLLGVALLPGGSGAIHYAAIQVAALSVASVCLVVWALTTSPVWPRGRDLGAAAAATLAMAAACTLLPAGEPGPLFLATEVLLGAAVYAAVAVALDLCGVRSVLRGMRLPGRRDMVAGR